MNDWSYACMAKGLGNAIAEAAQRPVMSATGDVTSGSADLTSRLLQRRQQILDQVVGMLEAGRKPDQPVADAKLGALLRRQPLMRRRRRMRDQAFGVAEIVGDADQLQRVEKAERAFLAAFDFERAQRRAGPHLLCDDVGLRMVRAARDRSAA